MRKLFLRLLLTFGCIAVIACGPGTPEEHTTPDNDEAENFETEHETGGQIAQHRRQAPPESGPATDIRFPAIARAAAAGSSLELDTVEWHQLPIVYLTLVVKSGGETDPANLEGLSHLVALMLKEGTRSKSSAQLAEAVEFLGASLDVSSDEENVYISVRALSEHLEPAMNILAEVATSPAFSQAELTKLKRRELDRLALQQNDPGFLGAQAFSKALYGSHPYAHIDTTPAVVERVSRRDLETWHRTYFVPNNAFLVAVGDVTADAVKTQADRAFARWRAHDVAAPQYAAPPARTARQVIVVDRPDSVQSVIDIGGIAIPRSHADWVPLSVANQVLGGSAASRLFMDLRERRSLTYGAYSSVTESLQPGYFDAGAAVRTEVTAEAMAGFFEHLQRIVAEPPPANELLDAQRYLADSFPLRIDTPGRIAGLVADLRIFGLPDDYWDTYRTQIRSVTAAQAHAAARAHIHPDTALIVVVGKASEIAEGLRRYGQVTVVDTEGAVKQTLEAQAAPSAPGRQ